MSGEVRPAPAAEPGLFYGYTVAAAAWLTLVLVFSVHYSFGIFFKPLSSEFGWTRAMTAGAFSLVWIAQGLLAIVMGGLNDKLGPRAVLSVCGLLIGAGYLLMAQIGALWQLYLFYGVIVGAGLGGTFVPLTSTTARWFVGRRGLMTGIVTSGVGIATLVGPPIVSRLIGGFDWRTAYLVLGSIVLVGVLVAAQFLRRDPAQMGMRPYGEGEGEVSKLPAGAEGVSLRDAVRTRQFWIVVPVFLCYGFSLSAILLHLAPHATDVGMSATGAATLLAVLGGASVVGKVLLGVAADRIGNKKVYVLSFILMTLSLLLLAPVRDHSLLYLFAVVFGFAYGGLATAHSPLVAWLFGMRRHGLIFGVSFNGWTLGCALGPIVAGYMFDVTHSYQLAFLTCAGLSATGLLLLAALTPVDLTSGRVKAGTRLATVESEG